MEVQYNMIFRITLFIYNSSLLIDAYQNLEALSLLQNSLLV